MVARLAPVSRSSDAGPLTAGLGSNP
jgi:hypothetical protein